MHDLIWHHLPASLLAMLIGLGVYVAAEVCRFWLSECQLFPLPLLRRWKRRIPLLNRPSVAAIVAWGSVVFAVVELLDAGTLLPRCLSVPLGLNGEDGTLAVMLGFTFALTHRHLFPYQFSPDMPPGPDMAG